MPLPLKTLPISVGAVVSFYFGKLFSRYVLPKHPALHEASLTDVYYEHLNAAENQIKISREKSASV